MAKKSFVDWLYTTAPGRVTLKVLLYTGALKLGEMVARSQLSKPFISRYIKNNNIDMSDFKGQKYNSFQDFFSRKRDDIEVDRQAEHLISPCDGYLSAYRIKSNNSFHIKGSWYKVTDLVTNKKIAKEFVGGDCVILRLCANDYHHYCYIDDGFQGRNHFVKGLLHSVQPIALENAPVYRQNRRMWTILDTVNFGKVAQIEIGALLVGGIVNDHENVMMRKGAEMGHFELIGSTIVLLFKKGHIDLLPEIKECIKGDKEVRVIQGQHIANRTVF